MNDGLTFEMFNRLFRMLGLSDTKINDKTDEGVSNYSIEGYKKGIKDSGSSLRITTNITDMKYLISRVGKFAEIRIDLRSHPDSGWL